MDKGQRWGERIRERVSPIPLALSFAFQLVAVPLVIAGGDLLLARLVNYAAEPFPQLNVLREAGLKILPAIVGVALGYSTRPLPGLVREPGRWVFTVPAALYLAFVVVSTRYDMRDLWLAVFGARGPIVAAEGALGLLFPVAGFCLYSLGVWAGDKYTDPLATAYRDDDRRGDR